MIPRDLAPSSPRRALAVLSRLVRTHVWGRVDHRRVVLRWDKGSVNARDEPAIEPVAVTRMEDLPASVFADRDPQGRPRAWYEGFFRQGARLWTAIEGGRALGSAWIIDGRLLDGWYIPLEAGAAVIYGVVTPRRSRGRGIAPQLALAAARDAAARHAGAGGEVYLDCMAWNRPAQRAFAKAGFVPIAQVGRPFGRLFGRGGDG